MSGMLVSLLIQIVAGAIGGNIAGAASKDISLGFLGNTVAGAIGGGAGGQILQALLPGVMGAAGTIDAGTVVGQLVGGGVAGAVLTWIVGFITNRQ
jgi:hypothetical protein